MSAAPPTSPARLVTAGRPSTPGLDPPVTPSPAVGSATMLLRDGSLRSRSRALRRRRRRRLLRTLAAVVALVGLVVWLAISGSGVASPAVTMRVTLPRIATPSPPGAASAAVALPWPKSGQAAVVVPAVGLAAQSGPEHPVPVASLTKIMAAYVVLSDHPLAVGQGGPQVKITSADAYNFGVDTVTDQANVELKTGEVLTEYQMLEGLLVHSANDLAYALATWDAGGVPAFAAKMNADAAALGMHDTHFDDASGYSATSTSTAADLLKVTAAAMRDPVFAQIVAMPQVSLPFAGTVQSYTPLLTTPGVVGVKSGFTNAAGGGDVLAYDATVGGHTTLVLAAVTSQEGPTVLARAGKEALALAKSSASRVQAATVAAAGTVVARITADGRHVSVTTVAPAVLLVLPGEAVHQVVHIRVPRVGARAGTRIGVVTFDVAGQVVSVPVRTTARLK